MKVAELVNILKMYDQDSEIRIFDDSSDTYVDIGCIDIDESETDSKPDVVIFI